MFSLETAIFEKQITSRDHDHKFVNKIYTTRWNANWRSTFSLKKAERRSLRIPINFRPKSAIRKICVDVNSLQRSTGWYEINVCSATVKFRLLRTRATRRQAKTPWYFLIWYLAVPYHTFRYSAPIDISLWMFFDIILLICHIILLWYIDIDVSP